MQARAQVEGVDSGVVVRKHKPELVPVRVVGLGEVGLKLMQAQVLVQAEEVGSGVAARKHKLELDRALVVALEEAVRRLKLELNHKRSAEVNYSISHHDYDFFNFIIYKQVLAEGDMEVVDTAVDMEGDMEGTGMGTGVEEVVVVIMIMITENLK